MKQLEMTKDSVLWNCILMLTTNKHFILWVVDNVRVHCVCGCEVKICSAATENQFARKNSPPHNLSTTPGKIHLIVVIYYIDYAESNSAFRITELWWECNNIGRCWWPICVDIGRCWSEIKYLQQAH